MCAVPPMVRVSFMVLTCDVFDLDRSTACGAYSLTPQSTPCITDKLYKATGRLATSLHASHLRNVAQGCVCRFDSVCTCSVKASKFIRRAMM